MARKTKQTPARESRPIAFSYIRFSSPRQAGGGSLERQVEAAQAWCEKNGYQLDDTYRDLGVSAAHGKHIEEGAFSRFLQLVKRGKIPGDAVLIVERLDRLSRERLTTAAKLLLDILEAGVEVVTLHNGNRYGRKASFIDLMLALHEFEVAYRENEKRAERVRDGMARRRRKIYEGLKMNGRWPSWLVFNEEKGDFDLIPEIVELVRLIFNKFLKGRSLMGIARDFNQAVPRIPPFREHETARQNRIRKKRTGWGNNMVKHLLASRAVLGEFQPTILEWQGNRQVRRPAGPPVTNFFPPVIKQSVFEEVQTILAKQSVGGGRRDTMKNLFGTLLRCARCGSHASRYIREKGLAVVRCNDDSRGVTKCGSSSIRYDDMEFAVLLALRDHLNPQDLLGETNERQKELVRAEEDLRASTVEMRKREGALDRLVTLFAEGGEMANVARRKAKEEEERLHQHRQAVEQWQREVNRLRATLQDTTERLGGFHEVLDRAIGKKPDIELRRRIAAEMRWFVEEIRSDPWTQSVLVILSPSKRELRLSPVEGRFRLVDRTLKAHLQVVTPDEPGQDVTFISGDLIGGNIIVEKLPPGMHDVFELPQCERAGDEVFVYPPRMKPMENIVKRTPRTKK